VVGNVSERIAEVVIVAEDLRQVNFVRRSLRCVESNRQVRVVRSPTGTGSGEQFVRQQYSKEVERYRNRSTRRKAALIAVIDADTNTVAYREQQLENELKSDGQAKRKESEKIALLIPKRHIETWIACLTGEEVNETADYKSTKDIEGKIKKAAEKFYDWSRDDYSLPDRCVPSLQNGLKEIRRVD
jgi:hypothetical protein